MTPRLFFHPLASYCWKALIALYENDTPFEPVIVDLGDPAAREAFLKVWPLGKFPVLQDTSRDWLVPEATIIVEYLDRHYPGRSRLVPADPDRARQARMRDRFFDNYVMTPMQKIVGDRIRPAGMRDLFGVDEARAQLRTACAIVEQDIGARWAMGDDFTLADIAAAPSLYYADKVAPLTQDFPKTAAYLERLCGRPSFARVIEEAGPYFRFFPAEPLP
ncbi:MAG: glutathione S-transferase family protein [Rhizomicrobium sp.]